MIIFLSLLASLLSVAQTKPLTLHAAAASPVHELRSHPNWPIARPSDVGSIRSIVEAFFDAISASKGGTLDRKRLESRLCRTEESRSRSLRPVRNRQT